MSTNKFQQSREHGLSTVGLLLIVIITLVLGLVIGRYIQPNAQRSHSASDTKEETSTDESNNTESDNNEQTVLTVEPIKSRIVPMPITIDAEGTVVAATESAVGAKVMGTSIERILVNEGDWVNKGQVLAIFDSKASRQNMIQANANVVKAETAANVANADFERVKPLLEIGAVSVQEYERYLSIATQAKANLVAAKASFKNQEFRMEDSRVVAPVSGIISKKIAQVGSLPQGPLFTIIDNGQLEWEASINTKDLNSIKPGSEVVINLNNGSSNNTPSNSAQSTMQNNIIGRVIRVNPTMDSNRQAKVRVSLHVPRSESVQTKVQAGMLLRGKFVSGIEKQQILPSSAIVNSDGYDYVMLIEDIRKSKEKEGITIGTINKFKVQLGEQINNVVVVKTLLPQRAAIVRQSGSFLNNGDNVRLAQYTKPLAPRPQAIPNNQQQPEQSTGPRAPIMQAPLPSEGSQSLKPTNPADLAKPKLVRPQTDGQE